MIGRLEGESSNNISKNRARNGAHDKSCSGDQGVIERRVLRSRYLAVKTFIDDDGEDLSRADSEKFKSIINEVEILHQLVQKPREQVADAESLLDISNSLLNSVKAHNNEGLSPSDFITCLLRDFGSTGSARDTVVWKDVGSAVSHRFRISSGSCTMVGPMDTELKQQKAVVRRKRVRQTESSHPEVVDDTIKEEKTDTDRNMSTMFEILKKNRSVRLERLVLNRNSFAETVENLFALSFLVKDGRAEITVNEKGCHQVSPRNALAANAVLSGEVSYSHLIFRFDFKDWKFDFISEVSIKMIS